MVSCTNNTENYGSIGNLDNNPFPKEDILDLRGLLTFFDNVVKQKTDIQEVDSAYHVYMEDLRLVDSYMARMERLQESKLDIDSFMVIFQAKDVFHEIFIKDYFFTDSKKLDTLGHEYIPNFNGGYISLLDNAIVLDSIFIDYKEKLYISGGIPPTIVVGYQHIHQKLDFSLETIRLITAIHYISLISLTEY
jgi:hypothetical protein